MEDSTEPLVLTSPIVIEFENNKKSESRRIYQVIFSNVKRNDHLKNSFFILLSTSNILVLNLEKEMKDLEEMIESLISAKKMIGNGIMEHHLFILIHDLHFQEIKEINLKLDNKLKKLGVDEYFKVEIDFLTLPFHKNSKARLNNNYNLQDTNPPYIKKIEKIKNEIINLSFLVNINRRTSIVTERMLSFFIRHLYQYIENNASFEKVNLEDLWKRATKDLISAASSMCCKRYEEKIKEFSNQNLLKHQLLKKQIHLFAREIEPLFLSIVRGIALEYYAMVDICISQMINRISLFKLNNKKLQIKSNHYNLPIEENEERGGKINTLIENTKYHESPILFKKKFGHLGLSLDLEERCERMLREIDQSSKKSYSGESQFLQLFKEKIKNGKKIFGDKYIEIFIMSIEYFFEKIGTLEVVRESKEDLERIKEKLENQEQQNHHKLVSQFQNFHDIVENLKLKAFQEELIRMILSLERKSRESTKESNLEYSQELNRLISLKFKTENSLKKVSKQEYDTNNISKEKSHKLFIQKLDSTLYEFLKNSNLLPSELSDYKIYAASNPNLQESAFASTTPQNRNLKIIKNLLKLFKLNSFENKLKSDSVILFETETSGNYLKSGKNIIKIEIQASSSFLINMVLKFKSKTLSEPPVIRFAFLDQIIETKSIISKNHKIYTKIQFSGSFEKNRNMMLVGRISFGIFNILVPMFFILKN